MTDLTLQKTILDELEWEPSFDAAHIGVAVEKGIVTLSGHVESYAQKLAVERAVKRVKGVKGIAEEIEVRYPGAKQTGDDQIAKRARDILAWQALVPEDKLQIKVEKGWITLTGQVDWYYQKTEVERSVLKLSGVTGMTNLIDIKPRVAVTDVHKRIEDALKRNAEIEASKIRVKVAGGKVTLEGEVHDWNERESIERTVWSAPGVITVDDRIVVR